MKKKYLKKGVFIEYGIRISNIERFQDKLKTILSNISTTTSIHVRKGQEYEKERMRCRIIQYDKLSKKEFETYFLEK